MFSITWYSFHWVIIPPCFSLPVAYRAWNSSTSANVQWTRSMRHLSQVITCSLYALPSQQATPFHPSGFVFCFLQLSTWAFNCQLGNFIIPLQQSLGAVMLFTWIDLSVIFFSLAAHAGIIRWLTTEAHCPAKLRISNWEHIKICTRWTI